LSPSASESAPPVVLAYTGTIYSPRATGAILSPSDDGALLSPRATGTIITKVAG
jgi:hypothetical protein